MGKFYTKATAVLLAFVLVLGAFTAPVSAGDAFVPPSEFLQQTEPFDFSAFLQQAELFDFDEFLQEAEPFDVDVFLIVFCFEDDADTLEYLRYRYFNPSTLIGITEDPIRSGTNWYVFCDNNPIMYVDPSGLVIVNVKEYVEAMGGAYLEHTRKDGSLGYSVTYKGISSNYVFVNGKMDDSKLNDKFGWTNPYIPKGETQAVHVGERSVRNTNNYHSSIIIFAGYDSKLLDTYKDYFINSNYGMLYATIGATSSSLFKAATGQSNLISTINQKDDVKLSKNIEMINLNEYNANKIQTLFANVFNYRETWQGRTTYNACIFPFTLGPGQYNSNSFTHGILAASGMTIPSPESKLPGWNNPVPVTYFKSYMR